MTAAGDAAMVAPPPPAGLEPGPRPTFSVIVAAYQAADVVGAAVGSALAQTEPALEILVADDGSSDDIEGALAGLPASVRLLRLPHRGAPAASNAAVAQARGDFVVVLDADDTWAPERLARLGDLLQARPDLDLATTDAWFVVDGGRRGRFYDANAFPTSDQDVEILRRTYLFAHVAIRRARFVEVGGFAEDLPRGYDWDLQLRLLLSGSAAGCVLEPLADYAVHHGSLSARRYESMMARVELLDRAEAAHRLTARQRAVLRAARTRYRRRALAIRAEQALMTGAPDRRRAALDLMRAPGTSWRDRGGMALALMAPARAGDRLRRRAESRGQAAGDRVVS